MIHIPLLRHGRPYKSLDVQRTEHYQTGEDIVELSQANLGLIRRDLMNQPAAKAALAEIPVADLIAMSREAGEIFANGVLPLGEGEQSPQDYVEQLSATTGMPHVMVRRNMEKIRGVMARVDEILAGLTRGMDLTVLDSGFGEVNGNAVSFFPATNTLGVVLPSNSPGVHSLWAPAVALKAPLALKPGSAEPWSPYRMIQAFIRAGVPEQAFCFYPTSHAGGAEILRGCGRGMVFGDVASTRPWQHDPRVEVHGPGYSKVILGEDAVDRFEDYIDVIVDSILLNSGRSCVNASGVWTPRRGNEIAAALAERLAKVEPRAAEDPNAEIAPFANPLVAERTNALVEADLPGARDAVAELRGSGRLAEWQGCSYLLPSLVCCPPDHPLANREFLFPFASVVEARLADLPDILGPTLVATVITQEPSLVRRLLASPLIGRLNLGPIPTTQIVWDQPHEGNLFEHLYGRRAFQKSPELALA